jgi:hypothetical protein
MHFICIFCGEYKGVYYGVLCKINIKRAYLIAKNTLGIVETSLKPIVVDKAFLKMDAINAAAAKNSPQVTESLLPPSETAIALVQPPEPFTMGQVYCPRKQKRAVTIGSITIDDDEGNTKLQEFHGMVSNLITPSSLISQGPRFLQAIYGLLNLCTDLHTVIKIHTSDTTPYIEARSFWVAKNGITSHGGAVRLYFNGSMECKLLIDNNSKMVAYPQLLRTAASAESNDAVKSNFHFGDRSMMVPTSDGFTPVQLVGTITVKNTNGCEFGIGLEISNGEIKVHVHNISEVGNSDFTESGLVEFHSLHPKRGKINRHTRKTRRLPHNDMARAQGSFYDANYRLSPEQKTSASSSKFDAMTGKTIRLGSKGPFIIEPPAQYYYTIAGGSVLITRDKDPQVYIGKLQHYEKKEFYVKVCRELTHSEGGAVTIIA